MSEQDDFTREQLYALIDQLRDECESALAISLDRTYTLEELAENCRTVLDKAYELELAIASIEEGEVLSEE